MTLTDFNPAKRIVELEAREIELVEQLRVANRLLAEAADILRQIPMVPPAKLRRWDWIEAYDRMKAWREQSNA